MIPVHTPTRTWWYSEDKELTLGHDFIEQVLNLQAIEEGVITDKERLRIISIESDPKNKTLLLQTEIYRLLQH